MQVPSGRTLNALDINAMKMMAKYDFIRYQEKPFLLKSGVESHVYVYGREDITDNMGFEISVGAKIRNVIWQAMQEMNDNRRPCLIGIPTAGTPLAQAAALASWLVVRNEDSPELICHRVMREALKHHGPHRTWVNGRPDPDKHCYWLVDNVATNGESKLEAAKKFALDGYPLKAQTPVMIFVDRQQGAVKRLLQEGFKRVEVVYNLLDITFALSELGLWPKKVVRKVEEEIHAHQFV